jgi:hypothetical protein
VQPKLASGVRLLQAGDTNKNDTRRAGQRPARRTYPVVLRIHWGAQVALDLLEGCESEATRPHFVRTRPLPLPTAHCRCARRSASSPAIASRWLTGEGDGGGCGSAHSIASGSGSAAEVTAAGSAAKLGVTARVSRTGDVTAGGEDCN